MLFDENFVHDRFDSILPRPPQPSRGRRSSSVSGAGPRPFLSVAERDAVETARNDADGALATVRFGEHDAEGETVRHFDDGHGVGGACADFAALHNETVQLSHISVQTEAYRISAGFVPFARNSLRRHNFIFELGGRMLSEHVGTVRFVEGRRRVMFGALAQHFTCK